MQHDNVCIILDYLNLADHGHGCNGDFAQEIVMCLKGLGYGFDLASTFLQTGDNYDEASLYYRWNTYLSRKDAVAQELPCKGYPALKKLYLREGGSIYELDGEADELSDYIDFAPADDESTVTPYVAKEDPVEVSTLIYDKKPLPTDLDALEPAQQTQAFLSLLFNAEDSINVSSNWMQSGIVNVGDAVLQAQDFIDSNMHGVNVNPCTGNGNDKVTDFKYTLVENDETDLESQYSYLLASELPIKTLVYSGGKSLHAMVQVDAKDAVEYKQRVSGLHAYLRSTGFKVDKACKDPSRYTRVAGVPRLDKENTIQRLLAFNMGFDSWEQWESKYKPKAETVSLETKKVDVDKSKVVYHLSDIPNTLTSQMKQKASKGLRNVKGRPEYRNFLSLRG